MTKGEKMVIIVTLVVICLAGVSLMKEENAKEHKAAFEAGMKQRFGDKISSEAQLYGYKILCGYTIMNQPHIDVEDELGSKKIFKEVRISREVYEKLQTDGKINLPRGPFIKP